MCLCTSIVVVSQTGNSSSCLFSLHHRTPPNYKYLPYACSSFFKLIDSPLAWTVATSRRAPYTLSHIAVAPHPENLSMRGCSNRFLWLQLVILCPFFFFFLWHGVNHSKASMLSFDNVMFMTNCYVRSRLFVSFTFASICYMFTSMAKTNYTLASQKQAI